MRQRSHSNKPMTRVRRIWNELDYSQRRLFELQTGIRATGPSALRRRDDHQIELLEELYRRSPRR